jgi:hypothetical protein
VAVLLRCGRDDEQPVRPAAGRVVGDGDGQAGEPIKRYRPGTVPVIGARGQEGAGRDALDRERQRLRPVGVAQRRVEDAERDRGVLVAGGGGRTLRTGSSATGAIVMFTVAGAVTVPAASVSVYVNESVPE